MSTLPLGAINGQWGQVKMTITTIQVTLKVLHKPQAKSEPSPVQQESYGKTKNNSLLLVMHNTVEVR